MSNDRYYLTSDDIRQQQRINRAVAELIDPAPVVNRRRNIPAGAASEDLWRCEITEGEGGSVTVKVIASSAADGYRSVIFRGQRYAIETDTFTLSASDLSQNVYICAVKALYAPIRFLLAPTHSYYADSFSGGCVRIAQIWRSGGDVKVNMYHDRLFEWVDGYPADGKFAADLVWTGITHYDDEPEPIPFYDFVTTAEQKLMIRGAWAMMINGQYYLGTALREGAPGTVGNETISIRPSGHENDALQVFWTAAIDYTNARFSLSGIHYELITATSNIYQIHAGMIRIPLLALTAVTQYKPVREIDHTRGAPNIPELSVNPSGQEADAELSAWVYVDRTSQTVRLRILAYQDGAAVNLSPISIPFSSFTAASRSALTIRSYYNISSHTWSSVWFQLDNTPITTKPTPAGGSDNKETTIELAWISYNTADACPYVIGQNCTRIANFSSAVWRFAEFADQIAALQNAVSNLDQRVTALEQRT